MKKFNQLFIILIFFFSSCYQTRINKAFKEGYEAWMLYVPTGTKTQNPYPVNSKLWNSWQEGWHTPYNGTTNIDNDKK